MLPSVAGWTLLCANTSPVGPWRLGVLYLLFRASSLISCHCWSRGDSQMSRSRDQRVFNEAGAPLNTGQMIQCQLCPERIHASTRAAHWWSSRSCSHPGWTRSTRFRFLIPLPACWSLTPAPLGRFGLLVLEATLMSVISVVRLLKGIRGERLLPGEACGWFATALSCWRGTVSNLTCLNPQTPTLTASWDEIPFTGEMMNSVWVVGVLVFLAPWFCFSVCTLLLILVCQPSFLFWGALFWHAAKCWDWKKGCFSKFLERTQKLVPSGR